MFSSNFSKSATFFQTDQGYLSKKIFFSFAKDMDIYIIYFNEVFQSMRNATIWLNTNIFQKSNYTTISITLHYLPIQESSSITSLPMIFVCLLVCIQCKYVLTISNIYWELMLFYSTGMNVDCNDLPSILLLSFWDNKKGTQMFKQCI